MRIKGEGGIVWIKRDGEAGWYKPGAEEVGHIAAANGKSWMELAALVEGKIVEADGFTLRLFAPPEFFGYPIEANGPANIVLHMRTMRTLGRPVDLDFIEKQALLTAEYMHQLKGSSPLQWHEFVQQFEKGEKP